LYANSDAIDFVSICRPDATASCADLGITQETFGNFVDGAVIRRNQMRVGAN
jgi:hypothetical protein